MLQARFRSSIQHKHEQRAVRLRALYEQAVKELLAPTDAEQRENAASKGTTYLVSTLRTKATPLSPTGKRFDWATTPKGARSPATPAKPKRKPSQRRVWPDEDQEEERKVKFDYNNVAVALPGVPMSSGERVGSDEDLPDFKGTSPIPPRPSPTHPGKQHSVRQAELPLASAPSSSTSAGKAAGKGLTSLSVAAIATDTDDGEVQRQPRTVTVVSGGVDDGGYGSDDSVSLGQLRGGILSLRQHFTAANVDQMSASPAEPSNDAPPKPSEGTSGLRSKSFALKSAVSFLSRRNTSTAAKRLIDLRKGSGSGPPPTAAPPATKPMFTSQAPSSSSLPLSSSPAPQLDSAPPSTHAPTNYDVHRTGVSNADQYWQRRILERIAHRRRKMKHRLRRKQRTITQVTMHPAAQRLMFGLEPPSNTLADPFTTFYHRQDLRTEERNYRDIAWIPVASAPSTKSMARHARRAWKRNRQHNSSSLPFQQPFMGSGLHGAPQMMPSSGQNMGGNSLAQSAFLAQAFMSNQDNNSDTSSSSSDESSEDEDDFLNDLDDSSDSTEESSEEAEKESGGNGRDAAIPPDVSSPLSK